MAELVTERGPIGGWATSGGAARGPGSPTGGGDEPGGVDAATGTAGSTAGASDALAGATRGAAGVGLGSDSEARSSPGRLHTDLTAAGRADVVVGAAAGAAVPPTTGTGGSPKLNGAGTLRTWLQRSHGNWAAGTESSG